VVLSHRSLVERVEAANRGLAIGPADRVLWVLPMAHHFAVSIVLYLYFGATTVVETARLAAGMLDAAARSGATVLYGAPFHHALLAADPGGLRWPALRLAVSTAARLPAATAARVSRALWPPAGAGARGDRVRVAVAQPRRGGHQAGIGGPAAAGVGGLAARRFRR
jgi:long-chain acyl-CoA synthetase